MLKKGMLTAFILAVFVCVGYAARTSRAEIIMPAASGSDVTKNDKAEVDISNAKDGYFMAKCLAASAQMKIIVKGPGGTSYTYSLKSDGGYEVYPFSDGSGSYSIGVYEQIEGSKYAAVISAKAEVKLTDEFAPFIRPNQFVNYKEDNNTVKKAAELTADKTALTDKVSAVYNYVIENIAYDKVLAANVKSGYLPDVDAVLDKKTGICFDYAAVMAAMLRSLQIPTKLVVGYAGEIYHAWISVYSAETGWINSVIYFDGKTWKLMDPTFADTGGESGEVMKYIGDGKNYTAKYFY